VRTCSPVSNNYARGRLDVETGRNVILLGHKSHLWAISLDQGGMELTLAKWFAYRVHETSNHEKGSETAARFFHIFILMLKILQVLQSLSLGLQKSMPNHVVWTATHQEAFEAMKKGLCEATKLHVIEYGQPCGILTDASEKSVGCCLVQWDASGAEKPIAFASAKLSFRQMRWSTIEREAYAVIFTLRKFRNFVFGSKITIFSDHNPLLYLRECAPKSAKLTRWALGLQEFDIVWNYRPGSKNLAADCLSRPRGGGGKRRLSVRVVLLANPPPAELFC